VLKMQAFARPRLAATPQNVHLCETRLPFPRAARELFNQLHNGSVEIRVGCSRVDISPGQREACAGRKAFSLGRPVMPAEYDLGRQHVARKAWHFRKLPAHEVVQSRTKTQMMWSDVDSQCGGVRFVYDLKAV
jgi:hypothetical protein